MGVFMIKLPEPNHEYGYTHGLLLEAFGDLFPAFLKWLWMYGQTVNLTETGEKVFYTYDVEQWYQSVACRSIDTQ